MNYKVTIFDKIEEFIARIPLTAMLIPFFILIAYCIYAIAVVENKPSVVLNTEADVYNHLVAHMCDYADELGEVYDE